MDSLYQLCLYVAEHVGGGHVYRVKPNPYCIFILRTLFQQFFGTCYPDEIIKLIFMIFYELNSIQIYAGYNHTVLFNNNYYFRILGAYTVQPCGGSNHTVSFNNNPYVQILGVQTLSQKNIKLISQGLHITLILTEFNEMLHIYSSLDIHSSLDIFMAEYITGPKFNISWVDTKSIHCGEYHTIILSTNNKICSRGANDFGQLGLGDFDIRSDLCVINLNDVKLVSCGSYHTVALTFDHEVYTWGKNQDGQLGLGDFTKRSLPQKLNLLNIKSIVCGGSHTIALTYSDEIYSWGNNVAGQLGLGDFDDRNTPCKIELREHPKSVSCGIRHTMILTILNKIYVCGSNTFGQLGLADWNIIGVIVPRQIDLSDIREVICGAYHTIAVTIYDIMYVWGRDANMQFSWKVRNHTHTPCEFKF